MKTKHLVIGVIVILVAGAGMIGMAGLVWLLMHSNQQEMTYNAPTQERQFSAERLPQETLAAQTESAPTREQALRRVLVNGTRIGDERLNSIRQQYQLPIADGNYWYDRISGAWGVEGGPCSGIITAGLDLGGKLRADASSGDTGVFVNGRQLHRVDVAALMQLGPVYQGRYWVDAQGNWGLEGGPVIGNLRVAAQAAQSRQYGQNSGGNSGGNWSHRSKYGDSSVGGDGNTFYYIDKNSSYISSH